jgi:hypothetical protein
MSGKRNRQLDLSDQVFTWGVGLSRRPDRASSMLSRSLPWSIVCVASAQAEGIGI